jgi:hypothetical protein
MTMEWNNSSINSMAKHAKKIQEKLVEKDTNISKQDDRISILN